MTNGVYWGLFFSLHLLGCDVLGPLYMCGYGFSRSMSALVKGMASFSMPAGDHMDSEAFQ